MREQFRRELERILDVHGGMTASGRPGAVSAKTVINRRVVLVNTFNELEQKGWRLSAPSDISAKAVKAIAKDWITQGQQLSAVRSKLSVLRAFGRWIGKPTLVANERDYFADAGITSNARDAIYQPISDADAAACMHRIESIDHGSRIVLELVYYFGLNPAEAIAVKPLKDFRDGLLHVPQSSRGSFTRAIRVDTLEQKQLMQASIEYASGNKGRLYPAGKDAKKALGRFKRILRSAGMTKENGITAMNFKIAYEARRVSNEAIEAEIMRMRIQKKVGKLSLEELGNLEKQL